MYTFFLYTGMSGYQRTGLDAGERTIFVRATSTETGSVLNVNSSFNVSEDAIEITNIVGKYTNVIRHNSYQYFLSKSKF